MEEGADFDELFTGIDNTARKRDFGGTLVGIPCCLSSTQLYLHGDESVSAIIHALLGRRSIDE